MRYDTLAHIPFERETRVWQLTSTHGHGIQHSTSHIHIHIHSHAIDELEYFEKSYAIYSIFIEYVFIRACGISSSTVCSVFAVCITLPLKR